MNRALRGILILTALLALAALPAPTLEGRWKLIEQRYGSGQSHLIAIDPPLRLEFFVAGGKLTARVWPALDRPQPLAWPAFLSEHAAHPIEIKQVAIRPGDNLARALYRLKPAAPESDEIEILEEYRLAEEGGVLVGTVTVTAHGKTGPAGSYVLQRRFVREP